jgi:RHS repeat-associated protein
MSMMRRCLTTFSLVTLLLACAAPAFVAGLVTPAHAATDFVVLGDEGISIEKESTIVGGDVGANRASAGLFLRHGVEVSLDKQVRLLDPASRVLGHRVHLDQGVQVFDVHTNTLSGPGPVGGQVITPLALPVVPALPAVPPITPGPQDLSVPQQGSLTLAAGSYGTLTVGKEATVTLAGGLYHFAAWALDKQVRLQIQAPVEIRIAGRLAIDKEAVLGPAPGTSLTAADLLLIVTGVNGATGALDVTPKAADIGKQSTVRAKLYVPHGTLRLDKESQVTGALLAKWVAIGKQGQLTFEGGFGLGQPPSAPILTSFTPTSGPVGTVLTITGTNFDPVAANNQVTVNGHPAIITAVNGTGTSLTTTVPQGATTGLITVTTAQGTSTSAQNFTVTLAQNFNLSAAPALSTVLQGGQGGYALSVTAVGSFTGLVTLGVTGVPAGVTATFSSPTLTTGQTAYLTVSAGAAVPAGPVIFNLTGTTQLETGPTTQAVPLTLQVQASAGQTAVSGQFINTITGVPIPNVRVTIGTAQAVADAAGYFLLVGVPSGVQQLMIDANVAVAGFPIYAMDLTLTPGITNVLPPLRIMPPPPAERFTPINNATANQIITDPRFPGVEITLPAGVIITGWDGVVKNKVAIERLTPDQLPVPPPPGPTRSVYQVFFGTPTGGMPSAPIPVTLPNDQDLDPGDQAELWYFDASPFGGPGTWRLAGMGTVSEDGTKVVSDPGVGIQRFCGVCGLPCFINRQQKQPNKNPNGPTGADPVDLATGVMAVDKTDLVLPGRFPITIARSYNPFDPFGGIAGLQSPLGPGWALSIDPVMLPDITFRGQGVGNLIRLILPGNSRFDLFRQPDGTFRNSTHAFLNGAVLSAPSVSELHLRFKDGTTWRFNRYNLASFQAVAYFVVEMADRNGNRIAIERNIVGDIIRIVDMSGRTFTMTHAGRKITEILDPIGRRVQYAYDANGRLSTVTDLQGGITSYAYDSAGRITAITDARGIQYIQNFYGPSGRLLRQVLADGGEWRFRYNVTGATITGPACNINPQIIVFPPPPACPPNSEDSWENFQAGYTFQGGAVTQTTMVDPRGNATSHQFTANGFPSAVTTALGQTTRDERDAKGNLLSSTDALGRKTSFTLDAVGNVTAIADPAGNATRFEYEPTFNRVTKITDALNQLVEFTYDTKGNLLTSKNSLNQVTTIAYNPFGQPVAVADPLNNTVTFAYDANGNLVTETDPLGNRTQRAYDAVSRLINPISPRGFSTQFSYDALDRITQITDALNGLTRFVYDPNGNLLSMTDPNDRTTTYAHDNMDRLLSRTDALTRQESYTYDVAGNPTQFIDRKSQLITFSYDALNRQINVSYSDGSNTIFVYDAVGRLSRATDSLTGAIEQTYDNLSRLIREVTSQGTVDYQYDVLGRRTLMRVNGQAPVTYQYDAASRLTQVAQGTQAVSIGYDAAGRKTSLAYSNGVVTTYAYDSASRLTGILHQGPLGVIESVSYGYDAAGSPISLTRSNGTASNLPTAVLAAYDAANEQIKFGQPLPAVPNLEYDANGNLEREKDGTGVVARQYVWDARDRLAGISGPGVSSSFAYDALGRRISKTVNGVTTHFLYDGHDIVQEVGNGAVGSTYLRSLIIDEPFVRQGTTNDYYHVDALGSTLLLSNDEGVPIANYSYEAFGKTMLTGTSSNPFQYTSRENDSTGLYAYRARYYHPTLQRFISEDQNVFGALANLYTYAGNNPLYFLDPFGLSKGGKQKMQFNDPATLDSKGNPITKQSPPDEIGKAVRKAESTLRQADISAGRRGALKDFIKVFGKIAKRAGTYGIVIGIGIDLLLPDPAGAGLPDSQGGPK